MKIIKYLACIVVLSTTGCSTITKDALQPVSVSSKDMNGQPVDGANCTMRNDKGTGSLTTPTVVKLKRSSKDLLVECQKPGYPNGKLRAISRSTASLYGNAIFGGLVGAAIDHSSGKAYDYPNRLEIVMGDSTIADSKTQRRR